MERTRTEVDEQLNRAMDAQDAVGSKWPGMSYEQGVEAALRWARGDTSNEPMPNE